MSYNTQIPRPGDYQDKSQGDIQSNFNVANNIMGINHYPFNDGTANKGKHIKVDLVSGSKPVSVAGQNTIYVKQADGLPGLLESQLFSTPDASGNEYQLTRTIASLNGLFAKNTNNYNLVGATFNGGWTFLPGGMLLQYGYQNPCPSNTTFIIPFPVQFDNAVFSVTITPITTLNPTSFMIINSLGSTTDFVVNNKSGSYTALYWMAIGV